MSTTSIDEISAAVEGTTAARQFLDMIERHGATPALHAMNDTGGWHSWTWNEVAEQVAKAAAGFIAMGVKPGDRVLLMMRNRPDFHWLDLAAQFVRATPVSIYNSSSAEEIGYLAGHAGAEVAIVEDRGFLDTMRAARHELPALRTIAVIDPPPELESGDALGTGGAGGMADGDGVDGSGNDGDGVVPATVLFGHGAADLRALADATEPSDLATLIYTSGTTGPPKGVMISQRNVTYTVEMLRQTIDLDRYDGTRVVSYLPMAHIAERMISHYLATTLGFSVYCCPSAGQLPSYLTEVRPEIMFGVPRVFEKIYHGVNAVLAADDERKQKFAEAIEAALEIKAAERAGAATDEQREAWGFFDAIAFSTVRELVGLDQMRVAVTGAAPIPQAILEWFDAIGVPLSEVYGMSESSGPMCWSPHANRPGTVGQAVVGCEVEIAEDGEIVCRGGNVFEGYYKQPDKTAETVVDGWLHSGDIGEIGPDGYVRVVDRKKELIITSGGKNISPANLEASLKMIPLVGQAAAIGDNRKFVSAIVTLDPESVAVWAAAKGKDGASLAELAADPDVIAEMQEGVDEMNTKFAQVEQIKRFTIVGEEWQPDSDVLTPTSKLKRRGINTRYAAEIEAMYS